MILPVRRGDVKQFAGATVIRLTFYACDTKMRTGKMSTLLFISFILNDLRWGIE
jgi:hypothetical protein